MHAHQQSHYYIQATCLLIHPNDSFQFVLPCGPFKQLLILCLHMAFRLQSAAPIDARRRYSASVGRTTVYLQLNVSPRQFVSRLTSDHESDLRSFICLTSTLVCDTMATPSPLVLETTSARLHQCSAVLLFIKPDFQISRA